MQTPCRSSRHGARALLLTLALAGGPAWAASFAVDTTADLTDSSPGDGVCRNAAETCSLRAAVQEANALSGPDTIELPAGIFTLQIPGTGEDQAATGDLDIREALTIVGAGEAVTVVDGGLLDRVLELVSEPASLNVELRNLTLARGAVTVTANGGCLSNPARSVLTLANVTVRDCQFAFGKGAGVFNAGRIEGDDVSLLVNKGQGFGQGGGLANVGPNAQVHLRHCEVRGNVAQTGAGLYATAQPPGRRGQIRLERCFVGDNAAGQLGGGIHLDSWNVVTLTDTTIAANTAGFGGGLFNDGSGVFVIRNSTIRDNHASSVGGGIGEVHFWPDFILVSNSVIAGNTATVRGPDCNRNLRSEGATLIGNTADCLPTTATGDLFDVDPLLGPLLAVTPRTRAYAPLPGSPLIDVGTEQFCTATDQTGLTRPRDGDGDGLARCDLGAIELPGARPGGRRPGSGLLRDAHVDPGRP